METATETGANRHEIARTHFIRGRKNGHAAPVYVATGLPTVLPSVDAERTSLRMPSLPAIQPPQNPAG